MYEISASFLPNETVAEHPLLHPKQCLTVSMFLCDKFKYCCWVALRKNKVGTPHPFSERFGAKNAGHMLETNGAYFQMVQLLEYQSIMVTILSRLVLGQCQKFRRQNENTLVPNGAS